MTAADPKFILRIIGWQVVFTIGTAILAAIAAPRLLLLSGGLEEPTSLAVLTAIGIGGALAAGPTWWALRRHRYVLRALSLGSRSVEPFEMAALAGEIGGVTTRWIALPLVSLGFVVVWRPATMDVATATSVALVAAILVAAASLPLHVLMRAAFLDAIEMADPQVMSEVIEVAEARGVTRHRVAQRLLAALATPVAFVALGSALIANAHLRRADERQREETARALARAALEMGPGVVATAGLDEAIAVAQELGFEATVGHEPGDYRIARTKMGLTQLTTPLDAGHARVVFSGSTIPVLSPESLAIIAVVVSLAAGLGFALGRVLSEDLSNATNGVRSLSVKSLRARVTRSARFRAVAELGAAIERLADRFRVFARAQRKAIRAREDVARMRGLFFTSVSHDLKSPLNAILGFTELVRQESTLTTGQMESLTQIDRAGRELLALIETVLDAARVEAKQLSLVREPVKLSELFGQAIEIGHDLAGEHDVVVIGEIAEGTPAVLVDRVRMVRALATFVGQALRSTTGTSVRLRARRESGEYTTIEVEIPDPNATAQQLEAVLDPRRRTNASEPRGLALGIGLARSVIELHGGQVRAAKTELGFPCTRVQLPIVEQQEQAAET